MTQAQTFDALAFVKAKRAERASGFNALEFVKRKRAEKLAAASTPPAPSPLGQEAQGPITGFISGAIRGAFPTSGFLADEAARALVRGGIGIPESAAGAVQGAGGTLETLGRMGQVAPAAGVVGARMLVQNPGAVARNMLLGPEVAPLPLDATAQDIMRAANQQADADPVPMVQAGRFLRNVAEPAMEFYGQRKADPAIAPSPLAQAQPFSPSGLTSSVAENLPQLAVQLAAAYMSGGAGASGRIAGFAGSAFPMELGAAQAAGREGFIQQGVSPEDAALKAAPGAALQAAVNTIIESASGAGIFAPAEKAAAKAGLFRQAWEIMRRGARAGATGGVTEAAQEGVNIAGELASGSNPNAGQGAGMRMLQAGVVGGLLEGPAGAFEGGRESAVRPGAQPTAQTTQPPIGQAPDNPTAPPDNRGQAPDPSPLDEAAALAEQRLNQQFNTPAPVGSPLADQAASSQPEQGAVSDPTASVLPASQTGPVVGGATSPSPQSTREPWQMTRGEYRDWSYTKEYREARSAAEQADKDAENAVIKMEQEIGVDSRSAMQGLSSVDGVSPKAFGLVQAADAMRQQKEFNAALEAMPEQFRKKYADAVAKWERAHARARSFEDFNTAQEMAKEYGLSNPSESPKSSNSQAPVSSSNPPAKPDSSTQPQGQGAVSDPTASVLLDLGINPADFAARVEQARVDQYRANPQQAYLDGNITRDQLVAFLEQRVANDPGEQLRRQAEARATGPQREMRRVDINPRPAVTINPNAQQQTAQQRRVPDRLDIVGRARKITEAIGKGWILDRRFGLMDTRQQEDMIRAGERLDPIWGETIKPEADQATLERLGIARVPQARPEPAKTPQGRAGTLADLLGMDSEADAQRYTNTLSPSERERLGLPQRAPEVQQQGQGSDSPTTTPAPKSTPPAKALQGTPELPAPSSSPSTEANRPVPSPQSTREPWQMTRGEYEGQSKVWNHQTWREFSAFDMKEARRLHPRRADSIDSLGFWFTDAKNTRMYGPVNVASRVEVKNPYSVKDTDNKAAWSILDEEMKRAGGPQAFREKLIRDGHDGVVLENTRTDMPKSSGESHNILIAFDPAQIEMIARDVDASAFEGQPTKPTPFSKHRAIVEAAHAAGKPVPPEVLAEYGLKAKTSAAPQNPARSQGSTGESVTLPDRGGRVIEPPGGAPIGRNGTESAPAVNPDQMTGGQMRKYLASIGVDNRGDVQTLRDRIKQVQRGEEPTPYTPAGPAPTGWEVADNLKKSIEHAKARPGWRLEHQSESGSAYLVHEASGKMVRVSDHAVPQTRDRELFGGTPPWAGNEAINQRTGDARREFDRIAKAIEDDHAEAVAEASANPPAKPDSSTQPQGQAAATTNKERTNGEEEAPQAQVLNTGTAAPAQGTGAVSAEPFTRTDGTAKEAGTSGTGGASPGIPFRTTPDINDRAAAKLLDWSSRARKRFDDWMGRQQRGESMGSGVDPTPYIDLAASVAFKALASGVTSKSGRKLTAFVEGRMADIRAKWPALNVTTATLRRQVRNMLAAANDDRDKIIAAYAEARERAERGRTRKMGESTGKPAEVREAVANATAERPDVAAKIIDAVRRGLRQGRAEGMRTASDALKPLIRQARDAAKRARQVAAIETRGAVDAAKAAAADRAATEKGIRDQAVRLVQETPIAGRRKYLKAVASAATMSDLARILHRLRGDLAKETGRHFALRAEKLEKNLRTLNADRRENARKLIDDVRKLYALLRDKDTGTARREEIAEQIRESFEALNTIFHEQKNQDKVSILGRAIQASDHREKMVESLEKRPEIPAPTNPNRKRDKGRIRVALDKFLTFQSLMQALDQEFYGNGMFARAGRAMAERRTAEFAKVQEFTDRADKIVRKYGYKGLGDFLAKSSGVLGEASQQWINVSLGEFKRITLGNALDIYARDAETREKMHKGQTFTFDAEGGTNSFTINDNKLSEIENALTREQKQLAREVNRLRSDMQFDRMDEVYKLITGNYLVQVPEHYPIRRAMKLSESPDITKGLGEWTIKRMEEAGYLKQRVGGSAPIVIGDFGMTQLRQVQMAEAFINRASIVKYLGATMLHPDVRKAVVRHHGTKIMDRIQQTISEFSGNESPQQDRLMRRLLSNIARAQTQVNIGTWARNLATAFNIPLAVVDGKLLGVRKTLRGIAGALSSPAKTMRILMKHSPDLRHRWSHAGASISLMHGNDVQASTDIADTAFGDASKATVRQILTALKAIKAGDFKNQTAEIARPWRQLLDAIKLGNVFDGFGAMVAYHAVRDDAPQSLSPNAADKWAARRAADIFSQTANTNDLLNSNEWQMDARRSTWMAGMLAFTSDIAKKQNLLYLATKRGKKATAYATAAVTLGALWSVAVTAALSAGLGDDEDKIVNRAGEGLAKEFASLLPGGTVFSSGVETWINPRGTSGILDTPITAVAKNAVAAISKFKDAANDGDETDAADVAYRVLRILNDITGAPFGPTAGMVKRAVVNYGTE